MVAIDVGHSYAKPGAVSARGVPEFDFNLRLAQAVAGELEKQGIAVKLIGADGKADDLYARAPQADGTRLLLSIHHDSVQEKYLRPWRFRGEERRYTTHALGHALFISSRNPQEARSLGCAASIGRALSGLPIARHHVDPATGKPRPWADYAAGVHYYDNLVVLRTATVPAVLLEAGVILNRKEEHLLAQEAYRQKLAGAIAQGASRCIGN